jgi:anion-transporting  ArsA/GET3 family ATPase
MKRRNLAELISDKALIVCVGSGGVGKTTTSAVIGLNAALAGRKVLVLTIDPARRLANALGLDEIDCKPQQIDISPFLGPNPAGGSLEAMMLDMKVAFDDMVRTYAPEDIRQVILSNKIYQYFSTSLAGTQEYAAAERLHALHHEGNYDLIVLDTPPTTHALDFLEAPRRIEDAVSNKAIQWLYNSSVLAGRRGIGIFKGGSSYALRILGRFTGSDLLEQFAEFLRSFSVLFEGLKTRNQEVRRLLLGDKTSFVVVTGPEPSTIDEALYFHKKLGHERIPVGAFVVNRVHPSFVDGEDLRRPRHGVKAAIEQVCDGDVDGLIERLFSNVETLEHLAAADARAVERLSATIDGTVGLATVPYLRRDVHSLDGLLEIRRALFSQANR